MQCKVVFRLKSVSSSKLPANDFFQKIILNKNRFFFYFYVVDYFSLFKMFSLVVGCSFFSHSFPLLLRTELQFSPGVHLLSLRCVFHGWNSPFLYSRGNSWFTSAIVVWYLLLLITLGIDLGCNSRQWGLLETY